MRRATICRGPRYVAIRFVFPNFEHRIKLHLPTGFR
jgi:hypothetical protein